MTTRALRLRVYLELLLRLRRKQQTRDRIQFLKQNPDAINEQHFRQVLMDGPDFRWPASALPQSPGFWNAKDIDHRV